MAQFWSVYRLQEVEGGSVVLQGPLLWYPRWWLVGSAMVLLEGVVLLTLRHASLPASPSPHHPFPSFSISSYLPPRDPWMGWVQFDRPHVQWWLSGRQRNVPCHIWWSFKLRLFLIIIAPLLTDFLNSQKYLYIVYTYTRKYLQFYFKQF